MPLAGDACFPRVDSAGSTPNPCPMKGCLGQGHEHVTQLSGVKQFIVGLTDPQRRALREPQVNSPGRGKDPNSSSWPAGDVGHVLHRIAELPRPEAAGPAPQMFKSSQTRGFRVVTGSVRGDKIIDGVIGMPAQGTK